ncbi:CCA tRNA nucleotidyltransferase [Auritidibacter ignavus]|uniref:CCA tRNA nucleotidyltransferase n=1 Tax=Auritidibacter ignavus TaxID=678932 RepID=UPI003A5D18ED
MPTIRQRHQPTTQRPRRDDTVIQHPDDTHALNAARPLPAGFPHGATVPGLVVELGNIFQQAGFELALVGGPVRDIFLGVAAVDLDFTTDATPEQITEVLGTWPDAIWDIGAAFGTIGARKAGWQVEITTYRAEKYDPESRKPQVVFGHDLTDDLLRRDFTVNAMALKLPDLELVDPFGGIRDLAAGMLRTPGRAEASFSDDPLRMMRAARFVSQLRLSVADDVRTAMIEMAERINIISAERVRDELVKLMIGADPRAGLELLVQTGLAEHVLPELPALRLTMDAAHHHKDVYQHSLKVLEQAMEWEPEYVSVPNFVLRFAAVMHDIGKPATRRFEKNGAVTFRHHDVVGAKMVRSRMKALRFDKETIRAVATLVELHMRFYGYGDAGWGDSAVRRYVTDAGDMLQHLHALTRSDVTTQNKRKANRLAHAYDDLEQRIEQLAAEEELAKIRPDLNGQQIMQILGISPGPLVGRAYQHLLDWRLDQGPHTAEEAESELLRWWEQQPESHTKAEPKDE